MYYFKIAIKDVCRLLSGATEKHAPHHPQSASLNAEVAIDICCRDFMNVGMAYPHSTRKRITSDTNQIMGVYEHMLSASYESVYFLRLPDACGWLDSSALEEARGSLW